jgi:hypothetical protein
MVSDVQAASTNSHCGLELPPKKPACHAMRNTDTRTTASEKGRRRDNELLRRICTFRSRSSRGKLTGQIISPNRNCNLDHPVIVIHPIRLHLSRFMHRTWVIKTNTEERKKEKAYPDLSSRTVRPSYAAVVFKYTRQQGIMNSRRRQTSTALRIRMERINYLYKGI